MNSQEKFIYNFYPFVSVILFILIVMYIKKKISIWTIGIYYILTCLVYFLICTSGREKRYCYNSKSSKIPCVIYTFWDSKSTIPESVVKCINSWKKYLPDYKINIITKENITSYIPFDIYALQHSISSQKISDFLRLYLLSKNGGIWMDASVYLNRPLDWMHGIQSKTNCEFIGYDYRINKTYHYNIESWFLACIPNSQFMNDWCTEMFRCNNFKTLREYNDQVSLTTDFSFIPSSRHDYLTVYISCHRILQKSNSYNISLLSAVGPLLTPEVLRFMPLFIIFNKEPVVKYTQSTRKIIESLMLYKFM